MECPLCKNEKELEVHDTTFSNTNTNRCKVGDHTGNIYKCEECDTLWLHNLLSGSVSQWSY
jgi:hypothetical protein